MSQQLLEGEPALRGVHACQQHLHGRIRGRTVHVVKRIVQARQLRSGARRAVKLFSTGEAPVRADTYATLGRSELERARAHLESSRTNPDSRAILSSIFVRVWAELGRTHLPLGQALELAQGVVVELDQRVDAPVELFANGLCFANGSLVVTAYGAWGVQVAELLQ